MSYDFKSQPHSQRKQKQKYELKARHVAHVIAIVTVNCNGVGNGRNGSHKRANLFKKN